MNAPQFEYVLEFSDENGDGLGEEPHTRLESTQPMPVPAVGDLVTLPGIQAKVTRREFMLSGDAPMLFHVQLFCRETE